MRNGDHIRSGNEAMKRSFSHYLLSLLYPPICIICREPVRLDRDYPLCAGCEASIHAYRAPLCRRCGHQLSEPSDAYGCRACCRDTLYFDRAFSCCVFDGTLRACLHYFKYAGKLSLQGLFIKKTCSFLRDHLEPNSIDMLIPVPLHWTKQYDRGYNQTIILTRGIAQACGYPLLTDALIRTRPTDAQYALNKTARILNVNGAFVCRRQRLISGRRILLIDDIFTTGATTSACSRALKKAGARHVTVCTVAR
ncbi:MAG: ComF family protein [Candidatus Omnitrophica bacterium]|nr:ComF family protein [Candidatus Omnitrophota bacterium]